MSRQKVFWGQAGRLFSIILILVVFASVFSGCNRGGGGGGGIGGGGGGNGGDGDYDAFNVLIGVWNSVGLSPGVTITISEQIADPLPQYQYFGGRVTFDFFSQGYVDITEDVYPEKYIMAMSDRDRTEPSAELTISISAWELLDDPLGGPPITNKLDLIGWVTDDNTFIASWLQFVHEDSDGRLEDYMEEITFKKQSK